MRTVHRNAWWLTVLAVAAMAMPATVTANGNGRGNGNGPEAREERDNGNGNGAVRTEAFEAFLPGVDRNGDIQGYLGYWSTETQQTENRRMVRLTVRGNVPNLFGETVEESGAICYVRLSNGDLVSTRDSSLVIEADGEATLRCTFWKPKDD